MKKEYTCCICGKKFIGFGNNPEGAGWIDSESGEMVFPKFEEDERCCDECNDKYVVVGRMTKRTLEASRNGGTNS